MALAVVAWLVLSAAVIAASYAAAHRHIPGAREAIVHFLERRGQELVSMQPSWLGGGGPGGGLDITAVVYRVAARDPDGTVHNYEWAYDPRRLPSGERGLRRRTNGVWIPVD